MLLKVTELASARPSFVAQCARAAARLQQTRCTEPPALMRKHGNPKGSQPKMTMSFRMPTCHGSAMAPREPV
eukprot:6378030-Lingulodinium_polyedra.AAC.1